MLLVASLGSGAARAEADPAAARKNPRWRELVAEAKDALAHDRLCDARDSAYDAQRIGDTPETSALLATALNGLGLVEDDRAEISHAALLAEKCLQQLTEPDHDLDARTRASIRLTCLSVAARAYHHLGNNPLAHERAQGCLAVSADSVPLARMQAPCRRILDETESQGYGVLGGTWWKYAVVNLSLGYTLRYFPDTKLTSPGGRMDGIFLEAAIGYPNFSVGPLLIRPEALARWERLGDELQDATRVPGMPVDASHMSSSTTVLALGGRATITYPGRLMTVDFGFSVTASQLRAFAHDGTAGFYMTDYKGEAKQYVAGGWSPEIALLLRVGSPEVRLGSLSFLFSTFLEVAQVQYWQLNAVDPTVVDGVTHTTSAAVRFGVAMRLRVGELKPYY